MIPLLCGLSAIRSCRPFIRNHAIEKCTAGEFLLINSIIITFLFALYVIFYEQEKEPFANLTDAEYTQYLAILFFAIFTVVSGVMIVELQREEVVITGFLLTTLSSLFLIIIGVLMFGETVNVVQFLGILVVIVGLYLITQYKDDCKVD